MRDNFDRVVVAFSGGKDSTLTLCLAREMFDAFSVYFWDKESNLLSTSQFILETFDALPEAITPYWFCLPFKMRNALSVFEPYWYCWDPDCPDKWVYQPPDRSYVIRDPAFLPGYDPDRHNLYKLFAERVSEQGKYRTAILVGLRADESLNRFRAVTKHPQLGQNWISQTDADNCYNVYPIYDWDWTDIWTYIVQNRVPYNPVYDRMFQAGLLKRNMRISQSFCDVGKQGVPVIRQIEPESFERWMQRVAGMNSLTHIDMRDVLKEARRANYDFLIQLYPEPVRRQIEKRIERSPSLDPNSEAVRRALLNNDIRLKRVNRSTPSPTKDKYKDL